MTDKETHLSTVDALYGEVIALRIVVQHLLTRLAADDTLGRLRLEHEKALDELPHIELQGGPPERIEAIRTHAGSVLDNLYAVASTRNPGRA